MADKELFFKIEKQQQDYWCWAANTASISKYYAAASRHSQCTLACACLGPNFCCTNGNHPDCDKPYWLDRSLNYTNNLRRTMARTLNLDEIKREINGGFVIGVRIGWRTTGGHAVIIHGYNDDDPEDVYLYVADPWTGKSLVRLDDFRDNYENVGGYWTHSYLTQAPAGPMIEFAYVPGNLMESALKSLPASLAKRFVFPNLLIEGADNQGLPHEVYTMEYDSLLSGGNPKIEKVGVRLIRQRSDKTDSVVLEYTNSEKKLNLNKIINGDTFGDHYNEILVETVKTFILEPRPYSIRLIRQPELKVEAFWLHSPAGENDLFKIVNGPARLNAEDYLSYDEFLGSLRSLASERRFDEDGMSD